MSRGDRVSSAGILNHSMRDNYNEHGYYKRVGSTYRNPHFPGIRFCLYSWLNKWWKSSTEDPSALSKEMVFFDMACGAGEATIVFIEWCITGRRKHQAALSQSGNGDEDGTKSTPLPARRRKQPEVPTLGPQFPDPKICAADPYTSTAFVERTSLPCSSLSFRDISEGALPETETVSRIFLSQSESEESSSTIPETEGPKIEMVVCSFALHLVENPSELFSLLWELSTKTRWLVVLAPHKKPEASIQKGWGWSKWNIDSWTQGPMSDHSGEILHERVHCRVYRSMNF
ncbi:hypothetical protein L218DRAFT_855519 [Marasmius fiardii PR-910]|nr:hypothetical protein L218DRAFT_855519 [Marasmius fiardii PR-910]